MITRADGDFVDVLGLRTFYVKRGTGPAVVLVHGGAPGGAAVVNWQPTIEPLAQAGFAVYAYDQPGFGYTDNPSDYSLELRVAHGRAFLATLGLEQFHLIGNSQGAYVAARLALESTGVERLVLISSGTLSPRGSDSAEKLSQAHVDELREYTPSLENMRAMTRKTLFRQELVTDALVQSRYELSDGKNFEAQQQRWATPAPRPIHDELGGLKPRTLLCGGRDDRGVALERTLLLFQLLPRAELHLFDECGHWVQWDQAERFNRLAAAFLSEAGAAR
jgi:pimeloyl-ACP methyl ester carboxylesterase